MTVISYSTASGTKQSQFLVDDAYPDVSMFCEKIGTEKGRSGFSKSSPCQIWKWESCFSKQKTLFVFKIELFIKIILRKWFQSFTKIELALFALLVCKSPWPFSQQVNRKYGLTKIDAVDQKIVPKYVVVGMYLMFKRGLHRKSVKQLLGISRVTLLGNVKVGTLLETTLPFLSLMMMLFLLLN